MPGWFFGLLSFCFLSPLVMFLPIFISKRTSHRFLRMLLCVSNKENIGDSCTCFWCKTMILLSGFSVFVQVKSCVCAYIVTLVVLCSTALGKLLALLFAITHFDFKKFFFFTLLILSLLSDQWFGLRLHVNLGFVILSLVCVGNS